uniref:Uncharacterized protein n=1 Tax=Anguilla anguilla TaxID=7936 RepID=A0A0E9QX92_ANGAN
MWSVCPERDPKHQATGTEALITLLFQGGYVTPNDSSLPNELHYITRKTLTNAKCLIPMQHKHKSNL